MKLERTFLLCGVVCLMVLAACPVYANWMPSGQELGNMFGQALGEAAGEAFGRSLWGGKVYDDYNKKYPYGLPDEVTNPQMPTQQFSPSAPKYTPSPKYIPASKPWWKFW